MVINLRESSGAGILILQSMGASLSSNHLMVKFKCLKILGSTEFDILLTSTVLLIFSLQFSCLKGALFLSLHALTEL